MAEAARAVIPIYVDCTEQGANEQLMQRFGVRGFPTLLFLDPQGTKVDQLGDRSPAALRQKLQTLAQQHTRPYWECTIEEGLGFAREAGKPLALVFVDDGDADAAALVQLLGTPELAAARARFLWVKRPLSGERNRPTDEAKDLGARKSPTVVLLDPWTEEGGDRELKKLTSFRGLRRDLEKALEDLERRGHPPAAPETPADPATPPPAGGDGH